MVAETIEPEPVPLARDSYGRLMVLGSRVSLDVLIADFKSGKTPESIHDAYETVSLADVYAIFAYYLRHRTEIEVYLAEQERKGTQIRAQLEAEHPIDNLRATLLSRLGA